MFRTFLKRFWYDLDKKGEVKFDEKTKLVKNISQSFYLHFKTYVQSIKLSKYETQKQLV